METEQNYGLSADQSTPHGQTAENSQSLQLGNPATIRAYFEKIRELQQSGERYPVNLDEVWPLVYKEKGVAVRALRKSFVEGHHYEVFTQPGKNPNQAVFDLNVKNPQGPQDQQGVISFSLLAQNGKQNRGGRPEVTYRMTVACLEHFVACKVQEVFEVYRTVFNQVMAQATQPLTAPATDPAVVQLLQTQTQLLAGQQQQIDQLRTSQQNQIDQLRADMATIQSWKRTRRYKPVPPLPGVRPLFPEPSRDKQLRSEIHRIVDEYCERITNATHAETYKYLYDRMQPVYGLNVYRLGRWGNESTIDAIERHGYLDQLYRLALGNLANAR